MDTTQQLETSKSGADRESQKIPFTTPCIRSIGNITVQTGQGGNSSEYDSYSDNRK